MRLRQGAGYPSGIDDMRRGTCLLRGTTAISPDEKSPVEKSPDEKNPDMTDQINAPFPRPADANAIRQAARLSVAPMMDWVMTSVCTL